MSDAHTEPEVRQSLHSHLSEENGDMSRELTETVANGSRPGRANRLLWLFATAFSLFVLAAASLAALIQFIPLPVATLPQSTTILDSEGNVLAALQGGVNRRTVALRQITPWLIKATIATEDRRFYEHSGVDVRGLARAAWVDMRHLSREQGASTLTQQLARNLYLSHERTWSRKLKEAWYAAKLEQRFSKDEILEMYLNQIYYGHGAYGAEAASLLYFGKHAGELNLAESAMLAGIPKGPRYYSPHLHYQQAKARQATVLQTMQETRFIGPALAAKTRQEEVVIQPLPKGKGQLAPYFVDYVRKQAAQFLGADEKMLSEGGLQIITTLDSRVQKAAEEAVSRQLPEGSELQAALVSIDPVTGFIKAMVGGRDYDKNQYNRVFATTRQPGSSFKPILYATALGEKTVTATTRFRSEPTLFYYDDYRKIYRPSNFNDRYFNGEIGLRQAIRSSDNIYAVNTIMQVGPQEVIRMARRLGVTSKLDAVPSLALGTFPVSPFEMASAYSVFAAGGSRSEPVAILRIADRNGHVLYSSKPRREQILSPALAYVLSDLMKSVFDTGGTAHRISHMLTRPVAAKSGTTTSDAWFVGYTTELATSVWVGYDKGRTITSTEAHVAAPIFADFTEKALASVAPHPFPEPDGVVQAYVDSATGLLSTADCPEHRVLETFIAGTEPTESCAPANSPHKAEEGGSSSWWKKVRHWWKS